MPKIEPAVTQLLYQVPNGDSYIDLAKDLSKVNRRLYRQGMTYVVQDIQIAQNIGTKATDITQISFATMGNSWIVHNAWTKAFHLWRDQQKAVRDALGSHTEAKWADFKIHLDDSMRSGTTLEPYATDAAVYLTGEWLYSQFVWDDDGTERETYAHMVGGNTGTTDFGLIQNYGDSRSRTLSSVNPIMESEASDTMYAKLLGFAPDELTDMLVDNYEDHNDTPPYDQDDYPGGDTNADTAVPVRFGSVNATQSSTTMAGFIAPCGLIKVGLNELQLDGSSEYEAVASAAVAVLITVAAGPYRGVMAAKMGQ